MALGDSRPLRKWGQGTASSSDVKITVSGLVEQTKISF